MNYRPEIDGLRAIAIASVVAFHIGSPYFPGGYIGVDVFFVISGFLITNFIMSEAKAGRFSVTSFYERRIRRLLPALTVVLLACLGAGAFLLAPDDQMMLRKQIFATTISTSNLLFYRQGGYFDTVSELKPLLHTWSLSVEEQFYIIFPVFLILLAQRQPRLLRPAIITLGLASLIFCIVAAHDNPIFNFYMPISRAWELLTGACLALGVAPAVNHRPLREAGALAGTALILAPAALYNHTTLFPGVAALAPVLGAATLIHMAAGTVIGRLLSIPPVVYLGLISYSLYLWHWPIIVFVRYVTLDADFAPLSAGQAGIVAAVSLGLAALSHHVVERPFRNRRYFTTRQVFAGAALAGALLLAPTWLAPKIDGSQPQPETLVSMTTSLWREALAFQRNPCLRRDAATPPEGKCVLGAADTNHPATLALWGDSQAAALAPAVDAVGRRLNLRIKQYTKAGCPPFLAQGYDPVLPMLRDCPAFNMAVLRNIIDNPTIRQVVLAAYWPNYTDGKTLVRADGQPAGLETSRAMIIASLERIGAEMRKRGGALTVIGVTPTPNVELPACLRSALANGFDTGRCARYSAARVRHNAGQAEQTLFTPAAARGVSFTRVDIVDAFCDGDICTTMDGDAPYYLDQIHLSATGAKRLIAQLTAALR